VLQKLCIIKKLITEDEDMNMAAAKKKNEGPTVIKKYANRRLYDTGRSSYVTLDDLCEMVKEGHDFVVYDAKSGEDLTRQVLTQIIVDQESKDNQENLLPTSFLKQLIGFYGDNVQTVLPSYLEQTLEAFAKNQEKFQEIFPVSTFEEVSRQNMAMFENAMKAWTNFPNSMQEKDKK
jgi:polyhydroxyalkanoate synthesis repressor PhaR